MVLGPPYTTPANRSFAQFNEGAQFGIHNLVKAGGYLRSEDYETGVSGWSINGDGDVEFNFGVFRGTIAASAIDIGGADATSFHVDIDGNLWLGDAAFASAPFKVSAAGVLTADGAVVTGTIRNNTSGERVEITTTDISRVKFFTGDSQETQPGQIYLDVLGSGGSRQSYMFLQAPTLSEVGSTTSAPAIQLMDDSPDNTAQASVLIVTGGTAIQLIDTALGTGGITLVSGSSNIQLVEGGDISIDPVGNTLVNDLYIDGQQVSFGAADSAGAGFRTVKVPN